MNLQLEKQRRSPAEVKHLVSWLQSLDHLTLTVMTVPAAEPRDKETSPGECPDVLLNRHLEDDLANATWEDAEWQ